ncbi:MAG: methionine--tRNA ligase [Candidatus Liptonbacteria bacterium]|nr:methionine--tRNA ligase [Candidatus Liptonbacteria bacterium]
MATIDDFKKLDIRIGKVISAEKIEGSDKLLKLIFDFGSENGSTHSTDSTSSLRANSGQAGLTIKRQIIAGIAAFYPNFESLIGKEIPVIVNLEPRMLMGNESQGMILAANSGEEAVILMPEKEVPPGSIVR